jgi:hypothetical protein
VTPKQFVRNTQVDGQALKLIGEVDDKTLRRLTDTGGCNSFNRQCLTFQTAATLF